MPSTIKFSLLVLGLFIVFIFAAFLFNVILGWRSRPAIAKVTIGEQTYQVEIADTPGLQMRGLSGRESLATGTGMLFPFKTIGSYPFSMHGMKFALDFIWIRQGRVVFIQADAMPDQGLMPKIYQSPEAVDAVLEVPAGTVARDQIRVDDGVLIEREPQP